MKTLKSTNPLKAILLFCLCLFVQQNLKAQWVTIPDSNFVNWLNANGFSQCMNGNQMDTTCNEVVTDTFINISVPTNTPVNLLIQDLTGIQYFDNLKRLNCNDNLLTSLPSLPTQLTHLICARNVLTSLPILPNTLIHLNCYANEISILPTLPNSLTYIECDGNELISLPTLPNSLNYLSCGENPLNALPALPNSLITLDFSLCGLTSMPSLPNSLEYLDCSQNNIGSISSLPDSLKGIDCYGCQLTSLPSLPTNLLSLHAAMNQLTSLPSLPSNLEHLHCYINQLTSLPPLPNTLTFLSCFDNQLTSIPALPDSLWTLGCDDNPGLTCLPELKRIVNLNFFNTGITCLPNYGNVSNSTPPLNSLPICDTSNTSGCPLYWNLKGIVYFDQDTNCTFDGIDSAVQNIQVQLWSGGNLLQQTLTWGEGYYYFNVDSFGNYEVRVDTSSFSGFNSSFVVSCPLNNLLSSSITGLDSIDADLDFALSDNGAQNVWITATPDAGCMPLFVQFNDSVQSGTVINSWFWDFGTGNTSTLEDPIYGYFSAGVFNVMLITQDTIGIIDTSYTTITVFDSPSINLTGTDASCNGSCDGAIDAVVTGGAPPYVSIWSNGASIPDLIGACSGNYSVTVYDNNNCSVVDSMTINEPPAISIQSIITDIDSCLGTQGSIDITASIAVLPVNYLWSTGETTEDILVNVPGTYTVTVTDFMGCTVTASNTVNVISGISLTPVFSDVTCFGLSDGTASVNVSGGVPPFTYQWSNGSAVDLLTNVAAGTYCVTVTDSLFCSSSTCVIISEPAQIIVASTANDFICPGATNGNIDVIISGGVAPYFFVWSNGDTSQNLTNLPVGNYSLTISDFNSCTVSEVFTIATDSTCVWPGDANSDGIANNLDILSIGIAHGFTDFARPSATLTWEAQASVDWTQTFLNAVNYKHADCDGDSIVSNADTLAVSLNYGLTHAKFPGANCTGEPPLYVDLPDTLYPGQSVAAPIILGTTANPVSNLYGVAFSIAYDINIIDTNSVSINYSNSWMDTVGSGFLGFSKDFYFNGNADVAMTRTDHINLPQRHGQIGILNFTIKDDVSGKNATTVSFEISINNIFGIDSDENQLTLCGDADSAVVVIEPNGIANAGEKISAKIYPNPASDKLFIKTEKPMQRIALFNVLGKMMYEENGAQNFYQVDIKELPTGSYVLFMSSGKISEYHRIVKL